jgi:nicotinate-nucleotide adenylyltransferase
VPAPRRRDAPADAPPARLGVLGGSFNPPHRGHLALARHALEELALDRVLLMPARRSPGKPAVEDPGARCRLEMCRLALTDAAGDGATGLGVCTLELERRGPSYTVDTLRALHAEYPDTALTCILGADVARTLPAWREPRALLELAELAVALRAGSAAEQVLSDIAPLPAGRVRFLEMPPLAISSSLVRERARRGESLQELVGPAVAAYIAAHDGLYRPPVPRAPAR